MGRPRVYADKSEKNKAYQRRKYIRRREQGLCVRCAAPSPEKINCHACTIKRRVGYVKG